MSGVEERKYISLGLLLSILIFFILSTVNLFTESGWSTCFADHSMQNPSQPEALISLQQLHP